MNNDILAYASLGGVVVALLGVGKFWMDMGATRRDASSALEKAETATTELSNFKAHVAEKYASIPMLSQSEGRLAQAIDSMRTDVRAAVESLTSRIDRILAAREPGH